ncbi:MAG: 30S ribosomal protein S12 methylthiotransferase RimO [Bacteroidales bacterium]|jgi:ribosomal protein S12 methylthiotransferase|nr:30S ribosomal protein S12 methylthiotransferase RimO [Bacteroidales bacterium]MDD2686886.1 30S ribosomal protein S12 methylthiotransferase RimO [Bacteroidales bacterium]MDD3329708.1 30S ribosomal protein S12 methylthiotransferase RimO [Bacteroidales bacterium]MDD3690502.1 30S ribosomal protein S12 methylthiotransferase RimO [Bacteroidales bacterium]MDD4044698.1 30S ribosomal protein S12 methylthiotransferase RimO [Bacteroidales bacterium]
MPAIQNFVIQFPRNQSKALNPLIECRVNIITLGCSKNTVDSEQLALQLKTHDFKVEFESSKHLPITLINTCGFIHDAKEQSIDIILSCIEAKLQGKIKVLIVFGCLSQRYAADLKKEMPEVDAFFGVNQIADILNYLQVETNTELLSNRLLSTPSHYAYLKVAEGCNHRCSFCIIPKIRGMYASKPIELIKKEAKLLAEAGVKEIILIAQDLAYYGYDLYKKRTLAKLMEELIKVDGVEWIRLHYTYPNHFPLEVLDVMQANEKVCHYLDIPIQHINDTILSSMQRRITGDEIKKLLEIIRHKIPDIALRTSLIVGYPGETKKMFKELCTFVEETQFDRLGVFTYSHEENTKAYTLKDSISKKEKERRKEELIYIQQEISLQKNKQWKGKTVKVLVDKVEKNYYIGRTPYDSPDVDNTVLISKRHSTCIPGNFYPVSITKADYYDLYGKVEDKK